MSEDTMPKLKRGGFRLIVTPRSRRVKTAGRKGGGRCPAKPVATLGVDQVPVQVYEEIEEDEVEVETPLPTMHCVVCYNEFAHYSLNCTSWETAMTKDFYVAMNIPSEGQNQESVVSLPFCPECHSKVAVMFMMHQQLKSILQNFNWTRNNLAFTVVETIAKNCRNGPLDAVRQQIFERWKDLSQLCKESNTAGMTEDVRAAYLDPALPVIQDCPVDHESVELSVSRRKKATVLNKDVPHANSLANHGTARKVVKAKGSGIGKSRVPEMPKLLGKLPSKEKLSNSSIQNTVNGTSHGSNPTILKQSAQAILHLLKKHTANSKGMAALTTVTNKNAKYQKARQLADGTWKCQHCPKICPDLTRMRRHESLFHPRTCPMVCHLCPKGFTNSLTMRRHLQLIHHQAIEGFVKCPYCEKFFGKKHVFELHINRIHTGKHIPDFQGLLAIQSTSAVKISLISPPSPDITDLESHSLRNPKISKRIKSEGPDKSNNNGSLLLSINPNRNSNGNVTEKSCCQMNQILNTLPESAVDQQNEINITPRVNGYETPTTVISIPPQ